MTPEVFIKRQLHASKVEKIETIQSLWSGYGEIARYQITSEKTETPTSIIMKYCCPPTEINHPRGWQSDHAHQRKLFSYEVEQYWYRQWSKKCQATARVAKLYSDFFDEVTASRLLLLEDLDASGYQERYDVDSLYHLSACISWLAAFHANFLHDSPTNQWPEGLWKKGTYWHLETRLDEYQAMEEGELKQSASLLAEVLDQARFKTLVHGDAKVANFCFSFDGRYAAAVDFQYIGAGVGVKDLAYLLGSALPEQVLEQNFSYWVELYFAELGRALVAQGESQALVHELIAEWQTLFSIAWADFHRFILGWCPTHYKNTPFSQKITQQALEQLKSFGKQ